MKSIAAITAVVPGLPPVVAVTEELQTQIASLAAAWADLEATPETDESIAQTDPVAIAATRLARNLEAGRVEAKAAPLAMCRAIDDACRDPAGQLAEIKRAAEARHLRIHQARERKRIAEEQERRRAAQAAADAEACRVRAEAEARRAQEEREAALAKMAEEAATPEDAAAVEALAAEADAEAQVEAERVAAAAAQARDAAASAYVSSLSIAPAPAPKSSTTVVRALELEIVDEDQIPDAIEVAGGRVSLKTVDRKQVEKLLRLGIPVTGARLVEVTRTQTRTGGRR